MFPDQKSSPSNESWTDWDLDIENPENKLKTPQPEKILTNEEGDEVHGAPQFNLEDKLKIEEKIKQSLNLEVSKFYDQESANEWDEDEEWSENTYQLSETLNVTRFFSSNPQIEEKTEK